MSADPYRRPALHQGQDLDCTAWAVAGACMVTVAPSRDFTPSARFLLEEGRRQKHTLEAPVFAGIGIRPVISALVRVGLCAVDFCPPSWPSNKQPDPEAYADAEKRIGWWEVEALDAEEEDVDGALERPNTVVIVSHFIDGSWPAARGDAVLVVPAGSDSAHSGVLCGREGDTYRYLASAGPAWADRGTARVARSIAGHSEERWRVTYVGG